MGDYDLQFASRQIEINEWEYNSKMDALFVYQIVFLGILTMSLILSLRQYGILGSAFMWYSNILISLLVITVIINRVYYNEKSRDRRFWNKIRFKDDGSLKSGNA